MEPSTSPTSHDLATPTVAVNLAIIQGDALECLTRLTSASVQCCVTSPPYWGLRDYGVAGQLGLEKTPEEYVAKMVAVFREVRRVLRDDGVLFLNLGDSYAHDTKGTGGGWANDPQNYALKAQKTDPSHCDHGLKPKDLCGIPWHVAFALQADGWYLRQDIIWHKPNPRPESVTDRCTKAHEYIFLLSKSATYYYDQEAIKLPSSDSYANDRRWESGPTQKNEKAGYAEARAQNPKAVHRVFNGDKPATINRRSVWTITTKSYTEAHFATFPPELPKLCILAGTKPNDTVLDPFAGSGTTGQVAIELGRKAVLIELNPQYAELIRQRTDVTQGLPL